MEIHSPTRISRRRFYATVTAEWALYMDPGDAVTNERNPKLRRAFFTKKSVLLNGEQDLRHKCVSKRFPELEGSMKIHVTKTGSQRASVMKREVADVCCVLRFGNCATKCFNIDRHL
ncbi:hypothetical protein NDU88_006221 [Pleurodeles waltl]|uniref:Uncharacterized protein n=1 Tax=Pleurodeles waltl TaxID=8319 RepID=A0AAV7WX06_PLEWA|nr:hypothetical protein NDU88_006221 [Pleurodeles waltl]